MLKLWCPIAMIKQLWNYKIFRFACIGVINTITDFSILNLIVFTFGVSELYGNLVSASISICLSYFWNHYWVFRYKGDVNFRLFIRFFVITAIGILAIQSAVIYGIDRFISIGQIMANLHLAMNTSKIVKIEGAKSLAVLASMLWNFLLYSFAVFKVDKEASILPY